MLHAIGKDAEGGNGPEKFSRDLKSQLIENPRLARHSLGGSAPPRLARIGAPLFHRIRVLIRGNRPWMFIYPVIDKRRISRNLAAAARKLQAYGGSHVLVRLEQRR